MSRPKAVWLDCDPGHDDAIALLLALFAPEGTSSSATFSQPALDLLGVSTTHGNATGASTYTNAVKLLAAYQVSPARCRVWRGADSPLMRTGKVDVGIHGESGLGGVECLPDIASKEVQDHIKPLVDDGSDVDEAGLPVADPLRLVMHLLNMLRQRDESHAEPLTLIATGPLTNTALLLKMCPGANYSLLTRTIDQIVIMGGAAGVPGNRSPLAEWNIMVDPEAASIVFDSPIPVVMAGLNVTHQAIFTPPLHRSLLLAGQADRGEPVEELHQRASPIHRLVSSAISFFASTYASEFGFIHGPPVHDMLTVAYVIDPSLFNDPTTGQAPRRYAVKIDTSSGDAAGTTIVDFHQQWGVPRSDTWAKGGLNAIVLEHLDTAGLWSLFLRSMECAASGQSGRR